MTKIANSNKPIALTMGDPAGVGPDITLCLWRDRENLNLPPYVYIGCPDMLAERASTMGIGLRTTIVDPTQPFNFDNHTMPVIPPSHAVNASAGSPNDDDAKAIIESIERAVELTVNGYAAAVVTNPIAKAQLYKAGFSFPGHTEFLAELAHRHTGAQYRPVMMLAGPKLRAVPVTIHIPLSEVPDRLNSELIIETSQIVAADMISRFGVSHPRIAIAGLNPHAGESGAIGHEDLDIIVPAVEAIKLLGINATGPLPADTMFHEEARKGYDVALCMYHDQALIPAKALGFDDSVNTTMGLPFIRTSPDHGTAFAIAGTNAARPDSLIAAMRLASQLAATSRKEHLQ